MEVVLHNYLRLIKSNFNQLVYCLKSHLLINTGTGAEIRRDDPASLKVLKPLFFISGTRS